MTLQTQYQAALTAAATSKDRGDALEKLACDSFSRLDGVRVHARSIRDDGNSQEIDVVLWNDRVASNKGLHFLPEVILIEAKNWTAKVGSQEVAWFKDKIRNSGYPTGILVAADGITGNNAERTNAHHVVLGARADRLHLLVLEPSDLFIGPVALVKLLKTKLADLAAGRVTP